MINEVKGGQQGIIQALSNNQHKDAADNTVNHSEQKQNKSSTGVNQEVSLTDTAAKLQKLEAQIANQPVVDTQRVESVKKAIADGSFNIDANRIAEKMASFEDLLASKAEDK